MSGAFWTKKAQLPTKAAELSSQEDPGIVDVQQMPRCIQKITQSVGPICGFGTGLMMHRLEPRISCGVSMDNGL